VQASFTVLEHFGYSAGGAGAACTTGDGAFMTVCTGPDEFGVAL
jgi:hypothetical protein